MSTEDTRRAKKTDLVLSGGEYAFTQDATTGAVKVLTGPTVLNVTGQEYPVVYDEAKRAFVQVDLEGTASKCPLASQGAYIVLWNPPATEVLTQPQEASKQNPPGLLIGQRINIPGPTTFSLWPRQVAKVIPGHHLRSNHYLLARVYDEEAAKENWEKAVLKTKAALGETEASSSVQQGTISELTNDDLVVGRLFIIKGTEVSFYIPPTGVEVVPDECGEYVREALTLERLQYCILVDENGDKDYQRGPKVVFPRPTQSFYRDSRDATVFRPTELNPIQGIHIKVIAPYCADGKDHAEGDELFVTGAQTSIYFPRPEHSLIRYDGNAKHFATAIPVGEGRYVMDRNTGVIRLVRGPVMLLCDPRREVVIRRVLSDNECDLWYPGSCDAKSLNRGLRTLLHKTPSTRPAVSEGEARRSSRKTKNPAPGMASQSSVHSAASGAVADEWQRAATYSQPRSLTLETKYAGVPAIDVWSGYAVMIRDRNGGRRVELGPGNVLLQYDETLSVFETSMGAPKSASKTARCVFLRIKDSEILDEVSAQTRDHVHVRAELSLHVDFVGDDPAVWFASTNYVQSLCDQVRRAVREAVRGLDIEALSASPSQLVANAVLVDEGEAGPQRLFPELGLALRQVDVVGWHIEDERIASVLDESKTYVVATRLSLERASHKLTLDNQRESIDRQQAAEAAETQRFKAKLAADEIVRELELAQATTDAAIAKLNKRLEEQRAADAVTQEQAERELTSRRKQAQFEQEVAQAQLEQRVADIHALTESAVARFKAAEGPLSAAISALGNQEVLAKVAEATSVQRLLGGKNAADVLENLFDGTQLGPIFSRVQRGASGPGGVE